VVRRSFERSERRTIRTTRTIRTIRSIRSTAPVLNLMKRVAHMPAHVHSSHGCAFDATLRFCRDFKDFARQLAVDAGARYEGEGSWPAAC